MLEGDLNLLNELDAKTVRSVVRNQLKNPPEQVNLEQLDQAEIRGELVNPPVVIDAIMETNPLPDLQAYTYPTPEITKPPVAQAIPEYLTSTRLTYSRKREIENEAFNRLSLSQLGFSQTTITTYEQVLKSLQKRSASLARDLPLAYLQAPPELDQDEAVTIEHTFAESEIAQLEQEGI